MTAKTWWRLCVLFGLCVAAISYGFGLVPHATTHCGEADPLSPILAFEFAQSPADIEALFGTEPCRSRLVAAMDTVNIIDVFAFIPMFVAFLVAGAMANRSYGPKLALFAAVVAILGGISDQIEDQILFAITADLPGTQARLDQLFWFVHFKFAVLALSGMATGWLVMKQAMAGKVLGALMIIGGVVGLYGLTGKPAWPLISPGIGLSWIALFIFAAWKGFMEKPRNS